MDNTIACYNLNADIFIENTRCVDMYMTQERFLQLLQPNESILDFGCIWMRLIPMMESGHAHSILHLPKKELLPVIQKRCIALKKDGVNYTSFKYRDFEGERNGRYLTDFTEDDFKECINSVPELMTEDYWITSDVRPGRGDENGSI